MNKQKFQSSRTCARLLIGACQLVLILAIFGSANAAVDTLWVRKTSGTFDINADGNRAMTVDGAGNVYVVGQTRNGNGNDDMLLLKYSPDGVLSWSQTVDSPSGSNDYGLDILVGSDGNVVLIGTLALDISRSNSMYVSKRDSLNGNAIWERSYFFVDTLQRASCAALDQSNNIYVVGWGNRTGSSSNPGTLLIQKFSWSGDPLKAYRGIPNAAFSRIRPYTVGFDHGYLYVAGLADSINVATSSPKPSEYLAFLLKMDSQLNNVVWGSYYGITDAAGSQYVSEWYRTRNLDFDAGGNVYASTWGTGWGVTEHGRVALSKFDAASGNMVWTRPTPWTSMTKTDERFDGGVVVRVNRTSGRVFMCAQNLYLGIILYGYDTGGNQLWTPVTYNFPGTIDAEEVTTDMQLSGTDSLLVAGFRTYSGTGEGVSAPFVAKYYAGSSGAGVAWAFTKLKMSPYVDNLDAVKVDPQGNIILAGPVNVEGSTHSQIWVAKLSEKTSYQGPNWYVDAKRGNDLTGDGSTDSPFKTIQPAVNSASAGHSILVSPGSYPGIAIRSKHLTLRGVKGQDSTTIMGATGERCVLIEAVSSGTVTFTGFTLTGGNLTTVGTAYQGGALLALAATVKIDSCVISGNHSGDSGGGLSFRSGSFFDISNSRICNNTSGWSGGAIVGVNALGGKLTRSMIYGNSANTNGGGIFVIADMYTPSDSLTILNCVVASNSSSEGGAGIGVNNVHLNMRNSIVYNNTRNGGTNPILYGVFDTLDVGVDDYNDVYGNVDGQNYGGQIAKGNHSISLDPQFNALSCNGFSLNTCSPCVDAGDPNTLPLPGGGTYSDIGISDVVKDCPSTEEPPTVSIPDPFPIKEGESFAPIYLDAYVSDPDDRFDQISWNCHSDQPLLQCTISSGRFATITISDKNWYGQANITFTATDKGGKQGTDNVTFIVTPVNDPPTVAGIPNQILEYGNDFSSINLNNYVTDPEDPPGQLKWTVTGYRELIPRIDSATNVAVIAKPNSSWVGSEFLTFCATDTGKLSDCGSAVFSIGPPPPTIQLDPNAFEFNAGQGGTNPSPKTMKIRNVGGGTFHWTATKKSAWLTLSATSGLANDSISLTVNISGLVPKTYYDTITVTTLKTDSTSNSPQKATVRLVITLNKPPFAENSADSLDEHDSVSVKLSASDFENDPLTYSIIGYPTHGSISNFDSTLGTFVYRPRDHFYGTDLLTFQARDQLHSSNEARVLFTILPVNDPPVLQHILSQTKPEGSSFTAVRLDDYVSDADDPDSLISWTYSIIDSIPNCRGSLHVYINDRVLYVKPTDTYVFGSVTILVTASDTGRLSASETVKYEMTNVTDDPQAYDTSYVIPEHDRFIGKMVAQNPDCRQLTYIITNPPSNGTLDSSKYYAGVFAYQPNGHYYGNDSFSFTAIDDSSRRASVECRVSIKVTPVNDPPKFVSEVPGDTIELGDSFNLIYLDSLVRDVDDELGSLKWVVTGSNNFRVTIDDNHVAAISIVDSSTARLDQITFTVTDTGGLQTSSTASFAQHATNMLIANVSPQSYRMISLPLDPDSHATTSVLDELSKGRYGYDWRLAWWNPISRSYQENLDSLFSGQACWVISKEAKSLRTSGVALNCTETDGTQGYFSIPLLPGWNQIGNPFAYRIDFFDCMVKQSEGLLSVDDARSSVRQALYHYSGKGWDSLLTGSPAPMTVGDGYFIFVDSSCDGCRLWYNEKDFSVAKAGVPLRAHETDDEWAVTIEATCGDFCDRSARFGVRSGATNSEDRYDFPAPPSLSPYIQVVFDGSNSTDFRSLADSTTKWRMSVRTDIQKSVALIFRKNPSAGQQLTYVLEDLRTFQMLLFSDSLVYHYTQQAQDRSFEIRVIRNTGLVEQDRGSNPRSFRLYENYPNPFNATTKIVFDIAIREDATLTIMNSLGQLVKVFKMPRLVPGTYTIDWNGTDQSGNAVASGVYLCRMSAGDFVDTRKMVLLK